MKIEIDIKPYKCNKVKIKDKEELKDKLLETTMDYVENDVDAHIKIT